MLRIGMKQTLIVILVLLVIGSSAQSKKEAFTLFSEGNYEGALEELLELYEAEKDNSEYAYLLGVCYLNTNIDKALAVEYLEKAASASKPNENADYLLGRAYHFAYQFDDAIDSYQKFKTTAKSGNPNLGAIEKQIEYCENAKEFLKFPINVSFENLGKNVNSAYPDYYPFIPSDESYIIFNSRRDEQSSQMSNGHYMANIYLAPVKAGEFSDAKLINFNINSVEDNEEVVGLNSTGDRAVIYKEDFQKGSAIYESSITEKRVEIPAILPKTINSKYTEIAASLSSDGTRISILPATGPVDMVELTSTCVRDYRMENGARHRTSDQRSIRSKMRISLMCRLTDRHCIFPARAIQVWGGMIFSRLPGIRLKENLEQFVTSVIQ